MPTMAIEQEIIDLENQFWHAIRDGDADAATRLSDDPCIIVGAQGALNLERTHFAGMLESAGWELHEYAIHEPIVNLIGDDVAVIAYKVTESLTVDGVPLTLAAADASTWVRRDGRWRCALHTESILGDPFGRDRTG